MARELAMSKKYCQLWLTCANKEEADKIANTLLKKRLIACYGELSPYIGKFWWQGKIEDNDEILLEMLSRLDLFDEIEREVARLHSYDTFVLEAIPISRISKKAQDWLDEELKNVR